MRKPTELELQRFMKHAYDPVKAHEYYMKTRDLKGRKKAKPKKGSLDSISGQTQKLVSRKRMIERTAMVEDGAKTEVADKFVSSLQTKSDKELRQLSKMLKDADAKATGPSSYGAQARTIDDHLKNREKIRSGKDPRTGKTREVISKEARAKQRKELQTRVKNLEQRLDALQDLIKKREHKEDSEDRKGKAKKERAAKENAQPKSAAEKAEAARENEKYRDKNQQKLKTAAKKQSSSDSSGGSSRSSSKSTSNTAQASLSDLKATATRVRGQIAVAKQKIAAL